MSTLQIIATTMGTFLALVIAFVAGTDHARIKGQSPALFAVAVFLALACLFSAGYRP